MLLIYMFLTGFSFFYSKDARHADEMINAIGVVDLDSIGRIRAARTAYNEVADNHKKQVKYLNVLKKAEQDYEVLVDKKAASEFDKTISGIAVVALDKKDKIDKVRKEYELLTDSQKGYVTKLDKLEKAEEDYEKLCVKTVSELDKQIITLIQAVSESKGEYDDITISLIKDIGKKYEALPEDYKKQIVNYEKYLEISKAYSEYKAGIVQKQIDTALKSGKGYNEALAAYNALDSFERGMIHNHQELVTATEKYKKSEEIQKYKDECQVVTYDDLRRYPDTYEGKKVQLKLTMQDVEPDGLIFNGKILAVISGTSKEIAVYDEREVREPRFMNGDKFTVYGIANGLAKETTYVKGTGLFGSDLFADKVDEKEIPCFKVIYTNMDK